MSVLGIDHVQVAAPRGCETKAQRFYETLLAKLDAVAVQPDACALDQARECLAESFDRVADLLGVHVR